MLPRPAAAIYDCLTTPFLYLMSPGAASSCERKMGQIGYGGGTTERNGGDLFGYIFYAGITYRSFGEPVL